MKGDEKMKKRRLLGLLPPLIIMFGGIESYGAWDRIQTHSEANIQFRKPVTIELEDMTFQVDSGLNTDEQLTASTVLTINVQNEASLAKRLVLKPSVEGVGLTAGDILISIEDTTLGHNDSDHFIGNIDMDFTSVNTYQLNIQATDQYKNKMLSHQTDGIVHVSVDAILEA